MLTLAKLVIALVCLSVLPHAAWADPTISGNLNGTFTGSATDGSGSYSGNVEGGWSVTGTSDANGNFVGSVTGTGTFGGTGISGAWQVTGFNSATKTISVVWSAPGNNGPSGGSADGSVSLVLDTATGIATGGFQGQIFTPNGVKNVSGTWTIQFQGMANMVVTGKVQGSFTGSASQIGNISGTVSGDWTVRLMPNGAIAGTASGSYNGGNMPVLGYGSVCVCGTWIATLSQGTDGKFSLVGSWSHPIVAGTLGGSGGGPIVWYLDTSTTPIQASGNFSGSTNFAVPLPAPLPAISVPISTSGNWQATLPMNP